MHSLTQFFCWFFGLTLCTEGGPFEPIRSEGGGRFRLPSVFFKGGGVPSAGSAPTVYLPQVPDVIATPSLLAPASKTMNQGVADARNEALKAAAAKKGMNKTLLAGETGNNATKKTLLG